MTMYAFSYKVRGRGPFPLDMLRYDASFPRNESEIYDMAKTGYDEVRTITLTTYRPRKFWMPTYGRWESFGWTAGALSEPDKVG